MGAEHSNLQPASSSSRSRSRSSSAATQSSYTSSTSSHSTASSNADNFFAQQLSTSSPLPSQRRTPSDSHPYKQTPTTLPLPSYTASPPPSRPQNLRLQTQQFLPANDPRSPRSAASSISTPIRAGFPYYEEVIMHAERQKEERRPGRRMRRKIRGSFGSLH